MADKISDSNAPVSDRLHPRVFRVVVGLVLCLIASVWGFFGSGHTALALMIVSLFIFIAVMIPYILWRIHRRDPRERPQEPPDWREWREHDFAAQTGALSGTAAAAELLLPLAAVAFGMAIFALVHYVAVEA